MNCPKCNSKNVTPAHGKMRCQDCDHSFEEHADEDTGSAPVTSGPHLIKCPACGRKVSSQAFNCPSCGQPLASAVIATAATTILQRVVFGIVVAIVVGFILYGFVSIALEN
jgi:hypothetical protein